MRTKIGCGMLKSSKGVFNRRSLYKSLFSTILILVLAIAMSVSVLAETIPVQGKVSYQNAPLSNSQICVQVSGQDTKTVTSTTDALGLFNAELLNFNLQDTHALLYLTIKLGACPGTTVLVNNKPFYPAGGDQVSGLRVDTNFGNKDIVTTGKLGVGDTSPSAKLNVVGAVRGSINADESEYTEIGHGGANGYINTVGDGNLDFRHDGANKMSLTSAGNLNVVGTITGNGAGLSNVDADTLNGKQWTDFDCSSEGNNWVVQKWELSGGDPVVRCFDAQQAAEGTNCGAVGQECELSDDTILSSTKFGVNKLAATALDGNVDGKIDAGKLNLEGVGGDTDWIESGADVYRAGGNVGIGTDLPGAKLEVDGDLKVSNPDAGNAILLDNTDEFNSEISTSNHMFLDSGAQMMFQIQDTEAMRIDASGNLGIGTNSPGAKLDVKKPSTTGIGINIQGGTGNPNPHLQWKDSTGNVQGVITNTGNVGIGTATPAAKLHVNDNGYGAIYLGTNGANGFHITKQSNDNSFNIWSGAIGSGTNRLKITNTGNLGVGTSTPGAKLDVAGKIQVTSGNDICIAGGNCLSTVGGDTDWTESGSDVYKASGNVGIGATVPGGKLHVVNQQQNSDGNTLILGPTSSSNLRLGYNAGYSWIQSHGAKPLYINELSNNVILNKNSGSVGIGTTTPGAYKLNVAGDTNIGGNLDVTGDITLPFDKSIKSSGSDKIYFLANTIIETDDVVEFRQSTDPPGGAAVKIGVGGSGANAGRWGGICISKDDDCALPGRFENTNYGGLIVEGSVGIGTDDPAAKLSIGGGSYSQSFEFVNAKGYTDSALVNLFEVDIPTNGMFYAEADISTHRSPGTADFGGFRKYRIWFFRDGGGTLQSNSITVLSDFNDDLGLLSSDQVSYTQSGDKFTFKLDRDHTATPATVLTYKVAGMGYKISNLNAI